MPFSLIDTHTHFDDNKFDRDRLLQLKLAYDAGIQHLIISGINEKGFKKVIATQTTLNNDQNKVQTHIALGLHPFFIKEHSLEHLYTLEQLIKQHKLIAIGEIGLDTFTKEMKQPDLLKQQQDFFIEQLDLAVTYNLPVLLHIRKAHAQCLKILKQHQYNAHQLGGIAHSFSGGEQEAKAFVKLGFKLGVTGQITNPNAKKLKRAIQACVKQFGTNCLVIETDSPDMMPIVTTKTQTALLAHHGNDTTKLTLNQKQRNTPANLPHILIALSNLLNCDAQTLAKQLWQNSTQALQVNWKQP